VSRGAPETLCWNNTKFRRGGCGNRDSMTDERDPEQAIAEIREKMARGEEPTDEEREFLERERVQLDAERDERTPSDLTG
jgi:hypothetical protein